MLSLGGCCMQLILFGLQIVKFEMCGIDALWVGLDLCRMKEALIVCLSQHNFMALNKFPHNAGF